MFNNNQPTKMNKTTSTTTTTKTREKNSYQNELKQKLINSNYASGAQASIFFHIVVCVAIFVKSQTRWFFYCFFLKSIKNFLFIFFQICFIKFNQIFAEMKQKKEERNIGIVVFCKIILFSFCFIYSIKVGMCVCVCVWNNIDLERRQKWKINLKSFFKVFIK